MESTIIAIIGIIALLLILSIVFKGIGFVLRIITNPKVLFAALVVCGVAFLITRLMG